jgi:3-hydroxyisobutyrate dehydrogenase-like beta-hydroxyacid dehydrogenase
MNTVPPVGVIGVGLLGSALTERLLASGHPVVAFDVSSDRMREVSHAGAATVASATDVFQQCATVFLSLPDSQVVARVLRDSAGGFRDRLVIDTTTGAPDDAIAAATDIRSQAGEYLEATVLGSSADARRGEVVVMAAGSPAVVQRARPVLTCFARQIFHTGDSGTASTAKLVVNLVLGLNRAVLAEGLNLARCRALDLPQVLEILKSGAAYSRAMETKGPKMLAGDFQAEARLVQHAKDVGLIQQLAASRGAAVPLTDIHAQLLALASTHGFADADNSSVIKAFELFKDLSATWPGSASETTL